MLKVVVPILRATEKKRLLILCRFRRLNLEAQVLYNRGKLIGAKNINFQHHVAYSGSGKLELVGYVTFGYWQAGSKANAIVLQPRKPDSEIVIGNGTFVVNGCEFYALKSIRIGKDCLIGSRCIIMDSDFHDVRPEMRNTEGKSAAVIIEDNVWLGAEVVILKGVRIGMDSVIAARCVVTKDVLPGSIVAGNPMLVIGSVYTR